MKTFTPATPSIIGTFDRQIWTGPKEDRSESIGDVEFDATSLILNMPLAQIKKIQDCSETSDRIGQDLVEHDGPCSVYIEGAICEFFSVIGVQEITSAMLKGAKQWLNNLPEKVYVARLAFTTYVDIPVRVHHPSQVKQAALTASQQALSAQSHNVKVETVTAVE